MSIDQPRTSLRKAIKLLNDVSLQRLESSCRMGSVEEVNTVMELLQESSQWFPGGSKQLKVLIVHSRMRVGRKVLPRLLFVLFSLVKSITTSCTISLMISYYYSLKHEPLFMNTFYFRTLYHSIKPWRRRLRC